MKIAIGNDHGGLALKPELLHYLQEKGYEVINFGTDTPGPVDYAQCAQKVAGCVAKGQADFGIVLCGTGIGISIAANKVPGIRCALLSDTFSARATRLHNNANMMAMGGRVIGPGLAVDIADVFLHTPFSNDERHVRRIGQIGDIEREYMK